MKNWSITKSASACTLLAYLKVCMKRPAFWLYRAICVFNLSRIVSHGQSISFIWWLNYHKSFMHCHRNDALIFLMSDFGIFVSRVKSTSISQHKATYDIDAFCTVRLCFNVKFNTTNLTNLGLDSLEEE